MSNTFDMDKRLAREQEVIRAMQVRQRRWLGPLGILWRRPWRSPARPGWSRTAPLGVNVRNLIGWISAAHDCADPSVGCSCSGGFRFPRPQADDAEGGRS